MSARDELAPVGPSDGTLGVLVASYVWLTRRGLLDASDEYRTETLREYFVDPEEWNARCEQIACYAERQGDARSADEFRAAAIRV